MKRKTKRTGPKPDLLHIEGDWIGAVGKAIKKKRPEEGWPIADADKKDREIDEKN